jgi:hypothetical protein
VEGFIEDPQPPRLCVAFAFDHFSMDGANSAANSAKQAKQRKNFATFSSSSFAKVVYENK